MISRAATRVCVFDPTRAQRGLPRADGDKAIEVASSGVMKLENEKLNGGTYETFRRHRSFGQRITSSKFETIITLTRLRYRNSL